MKFFCTPLFYGVFLSISVLGAELSCKNSAPDDARPPVYFKAADLHVHYIGRVQAESDSSVRYSAPGVALAVSFTGTSVAVDLSSETNKNFVSVWIDGSEVSRIAVPHARQRVELASGLAPGTHRLEMYKDTEAGVGSLVVHGLVVQGLEAMDLSERLMECYGNSITCGGKMLIGAPCEALAQNWNAPNKASASYGWVTARNLNARVHLTSMSGIGLVKSCCDLPQTMPDIYTRLFLERDDSVPYNLEARVPDVVTLCLGQNDGAEVVRSTTFKHKYLRWVKELDTRYQNRPHYFLLTSPMADASLLEAMLPTLEGIKADLAAEGIDRVTVVTLPGGLTHGCEWHPTEAEHALVAGVLSEHIARVMGWSMTQH